MAKVLVVNMNEVPKLVSVGSQFIPTAIKSLFGGEAVQTHWLGGMYWAATVKSVQAEKDPEKLVMMNHNKAIYGNVIFYKVDRNMTPKGLTKSEMEMLISG